MDDIKDTVEAPVVPVKPKRKGPANPYFTKENAKILGAKGGAAGKRTAVPNGSTADAELNKLLKADKDCLHPAELNDALQEDLGISLNPLREMERMIRAGGLSARDKATILKTMAEYTHMKRPSQQKIDTTVKAEDFLLSLADLIDKE